MSEKCQRCGEDGDDRRTLWMACLYQMDELDLPFKEVRTVGCDARDFYTLKVCKSCRADWMIAIQTWFNNKPEPGPETGYFVRQFGATIEKRFPDELS